MRLTGFRIDRFGVLRDQLVEGLSPGISVFLGDNEAGKSTLLRFFQAMLVDFKRGGKFIDQMNGGRDGGGGLLKLETEALGPALLHNAPRLKSAILRDPAGKELPLAALRLPDEAVFDAVFAIDLARLVAFSSKKDDPVCNALHGAAFGTGFTSPAGVLELLDKRKKALLKASTGSALLNNRRKELEETLAELAGRRRPLEEWEAVRDDFDRAAETARRNAARREHFQEVLRENTRLAEVVKHRSALRVIDDSIKALEAEGPLPPPLPADSGSRLAALETDLKNRQAELRRVIAELEGFRAERRALTPSPELVALSGRIDSLRERKEMFRSHSRDLQELEGDIRELEDRRQELLSRLGPEWTDQTVLAADASPAALDALHQAEKALREAEGLHTERTRFLESLGGSVGDAPTEAAETAEDAPALPNEDDSDRLIAHVAVAADALEELPFLEAGRRGASREYAQALEALHPLPEEAALNLGDAPRVGLATALAELAEAREGVKEVEREVKEARRAEDERAAEVSDAQARRRILGPAEPEETLLGRIALLRRAEALRQELAFARQTADGTGKTGVSPLAVCGLAALFIGLCLSGPAWLAQRPELLPESLQGSTGLELFTRHTELLPAGLAVAAVGLLTLLSAISARLFGGRRRTALLLQEKEAEFARRVGELGDALEPGMEADAASLQMALERAESVRRLQRDIARAEEEILRAEQRLTRACSDRDEAETALLRARENVTAAEERLADAFTALGFPPDTPEAAAAGLFERVEILRARQRVLEDAESALRSRLRTFTACRAAALALPFFAERLPADELPDLSGPAALPAIDAPLLESLKTLCRSVETGCADLNAARDEARAHATERAAAKTRAGEIEHAREALREAELALGERREVWENLLITRGFAPGMAPEALWEALELQKSFAELTRQLREKSFRRESPATSTTRFIGDLNDAARTAGLSSFADAKADFPTEERLQALAELGALVDKAVEDAREAARLDALLVSKEAAEAETRATLEAAETDLNALLRNAGTEDAESFRLAIERRARYETLAGERRSIESLLAEPAEKAGLSVQDYLARSAGLDADELRDQNETAQIELYRLEEEADELRGKQGALGERLDALRRSEGTAPLLQKAEDLREELRELSRQWCVPALARHFLETAKAEFEERGNEGIIGRAGQLFAEITAGDYLGIAPQLENDGFNFTALHKSGEGRDPERELSRGAREQLYLALRLAFIRHHAEHAEPLPAVMDDILVNFDPGRAERTAQVLAEFAKTNQILFFTCRPEQAEVLMNAANAAGDPAPTLFMVCGGEIAPM